MSVRATTPEDSADLAALYRRAFPTEDLLPLVTRLLAEVPDMLSLAIERADTLAGHVLFTPCAVAGSTQRVALLGPLAVDPRHQRLGCGAALLRTGLHQSGEAGFARVLVLGDPAYYGRHGFATELQVQPPYSLPSEWNGAWQGLALQRGGEQPAGTLRPPAPWLVPSLWAP